MRPIRAATGKWGTSGVMVSVLAVLGVLLATLTPVRAAADPLDPIAGGAGGPHSLALPASPSDAPQALATVELSTGAAQSRFPFDLPSARGGAQPRLNLAYDSSRGIGFAGVGWTLAVPSVVRKGASGKPHFEDLVLDDPGAIATTMDADDYYIDGQLLVPICVVSDCRGAAGDVFPSVVTDSGETWAYYRTQIDDGNRYFFGGRGLTWILQTKSGRIVQFGHPLDGLFSEGTELANGPLLTAAQEQKVYRWDIVRDTDSSGNTVYYVWDDELGLLPRGAADGPGMRYLVDVYDTPGLPSLGSFNPGVTSASFAHHAHLRWALPGTGRPAGSLYSPIWHALPFAQLAGIDVTSATMGAPQRQLVRRYKLAYELNTTETLSHLSSIQVEGCPPGTVVAELADGSVPAMSCPALPATTYTYYADEPVDDAKIESSRLPIELTFQPGAAYSTAASQYAHDVKYWGDDLPNPVNPY
ncbi:MAG: SpvB/TcaC N-terminal domain-containing protein, partial [Polyangiaceae bacterium]